VGRPLDPEGLGQHLDRLYRAALALTGSREDAEDLVQDTCLKVLSRPRLLARDDDLPYLLRALRNVAANTRRTRSRRPQSVVLDEAVVRASRAAEPERAAEIDAVLVAIAALPADMRDVLVAVDVVGLSYREAGRALGVREATVATRLFRARERLIRDVEGETQRGVSSAGSPGPARPPGA
jgi:RNA polymerase sigma-70 factor (ECF subfamily)